MPIDRLIGLDKDHFTGSSNVFSQKAEGLAAVVRNSLIRDAQDLLVAVGTADLTDSSGGLAGILFTAATTDIVTLVATEPESLATGDGPFQVVNVGGGLPTGLVAATDYWVRRQADNTYKLYLTKAAALDAQGTAVDITGTGTGTQHLQAIGQPTKLAEVNLAGLTTGFTAASADTSFDSLMTAYATLAARANLGLDSVGAGDILDGPETSGGATIAAVDVDVAANASDTTAVTFDSAKAILDELFNSQATVIDVIDVLRVAVGLARVPRARNLRGAIDNAGVNGNLAITNAVTTTATTITASATEAAIEVLLTGLQDNVAFLADMVDEAVGIAADAAPSTYAA